MEKFRVCRDGKVETYHETEKEAKKALRNMKLRAHENGYVDELIDGEFQPIYQKLTTSGKLLECF